MFDNLVDLGIYFFNHRTISDERHVYPKTIRSLETFVLVLLLEYCFSLPIYLNVYASDRPADFYFWVCSWVALLLDMDLYRLVRM